MRKVIEEQSWLGSVDIGSIELDAKSRDDIPAVLIGLQAIRNDSAAREELFRLLDARILPGRHRDTGRPGDASLADFGDGRAGQGLNCDCDRLRELADEHGKIQAFPGHDAWFEPCVCERQNIMDNVELLTPELLREADRLVVSTGHKVAGKKPGAALVGRCDSFVAETDVRHPTDMGLLRDSIRCLVRAAEPAPDLQKTAADAEKPASGAGPAPVPARNAPRRVSAGPLRLPGIRPNSENGRFSARHEFTRFLRIAREFRTKVVSGGI